MKCLLYLLSRKRLASLLFLLYLCINSTTVKAQNLAYAKGLFSAPLGGNVSVRTVATDATGNVYIAGQFAGTADFDPNGTSAANLTSVGADDIFFAKYDASGNYVYAKAIGSANTDMVYSIVVDGSGSVYLTGFFYATADFDPGTGTTNLTSAGLSDLFIAKYDASGNYVYAKAIGGTGYDLGSGVLVDGSGKINVTGYYNGTVDFDPGAGTANFSSAGANDVFLANYDASGNYIWAKSMGGSGSEGPNSLARDGAGNLFITGQFAATADFDPGVGAANLTSAGGNDLFFAKYDALGNYIWAKRIGGVNNDVGNGVSVDASNNVYLTGYYGNTTDFDPGAGTATVVGFGGTDIFVAKYDNSGNYQWAKGMGTSGDEGGIGITVDGSGNAYIVGNFVGTIDYDPGAGTASLASAGGNDIFVGKYDASGNYVWAKRMGSTSGDVGFGVAVDASNNVYVGGYFTGTVDFDPGAGTANMVAGGTLTNGFALKLDNTGSYTWAGLQGAYSNAAMADQGRSVATDALGNTYITGYFSGTADFDPGASLAYLTSAGGNDIYIAKYDASGNYVWAKSLGGTGADVGYDIAADASGNVYVTGYFSATTDFDPGASIANLTSTGGNDIFVAKYDGFGNYVWAKGMGNSANADQGWGIAVDATGGAYLTGYFGGTVDFDPGAGTANLTSSGLGDIFIAKYDAAGNYVWAKAIGSTGNDFSFDIKLDGSGNAFITGYFNGTVDFDPGAGVASLASAGSDDIFLAKYDASGNYVWAKGIGSTGSDIAYSLALDGSGNIFITGYYLGTADFDPGAGTANLSYTAGFDAFVAKYDGSGNYLWAKSVSGTGNEIGYAIAVDGSGNVYFTGYFSGSADFDPGAGVSNLTSAGGNDVFLAKYDATGNYLSAKVAGGTGHDIAYGLAVDGSSNTYTTGYFNGTVDFNPSGSPATLTAANSADIFLAKYSTLSVLPVHFQSVFAQPVESAVLVQWTVSNQVDNAYFEVERSRDGRSYLGIGRVPGCSLCSDLRNYSLLDNQPYDGLSYYRIKQVDMDGHFIYSKVVSSFTSKGNDNALAVYPTVTTNTFTLLIKNWDGSQQARLQVANASGSSIKQQSLSLQTGVNKLSFDLSGQPPGVYFLKLLEMNGKTSAHATIIKVN